MANATPVTLEELLDFIKDFVACRYRERGRSTHGAVLADAIRKEFPDFSYGQVGLERLVDAVSRAEKEGFVQRDRTASHLDVIPGPSSGLDLAASQPLLHRCSRFLRPELWRAFVFVTSSERHYMDRVSGLVRHVAPDDTTAVRTYDAESKYVSIPAIPPDEQQAWLRTFIENENTLSTDEAPINEPEWWIRVPQWLRDRNPELDRSWRRHRSRQVLAVVKKWADKNKVPEKLLFAAAWARAVHTDPGQNDATRRAILAALGEMSIHELENLSIPVRYVIRHFRVL